MFWIHHHQYIHHSHMYVFDPPFVTLAISCWSFSSVSCHLYQHSFIFYSEPFLLFNFLNLKQALGWKLLIFFYYCIFDPLGQIQSRNFLLIFICVIAVHQTQPTNYWRHFKLLNLVRFLWFHFPPVLKVGCVWNWKIPDGPDAVNKNFSFQEET